MKCSFFIKWANYSVLNSQQRTVYFTYTLANTVPTNWVTEALTISFEKEVNE